ncbi:MULTISPECIES: replication protein O [unclassified Caballeronia]|uniref:replication protein O n=1 Tax=unclassified Caballeronia TaxID=2646786 RepID=UPI00285B156F|nr:MULTISPECIES: replication protein O [unclassified Caballeronia]MDR5753397.1 replication protein O [Caballeronia sp. LZ024]MDR5841136.1 replication protein O [Caballeronia sp. LZ031]
MLIAQLPVAGEDDDRLRATNSNNSTEDHAALQEYACDRSNLPWIIFRAAHRANHIAALPARSRSLLAALARTVDANRPFAAIFARRELLTGRALQSMRTFYRSLEDLECEGFITRPPQKRHGEAGLFGRAYLHLTEKAAALLGLVEEPAAPREPLAATAAAQAVSASAGLSLRPPCASVADGAIYKDLNPTTQKRQPASLPTDLQRLLGLGFHQFLIFKLMREARLQSKRLSDVVEVTWDHLKHAQHPVSYLRALLRSPVDFTHQIRAKVAARVEVERAHAKAEHIKAEVQHHAGGTFFDSSNERRFVLSADGTEITVRHYRELKPRVRTGNWAGEFVAALEGGVLKPATLQREAAFASKLASTEEGQSVRHEPPKPVRTAAVAQSLSDMKRLLRQVCVGQRSPARLT